MLQIGLSIFANLPIIFAIGVAVGLSGGSGIAALAALVGYVIMNTTISIALGITPEMAAESGEYGMLLGIPSLETGVLGGIAVGLLAVWVYKKFHTFNPPEMLGFFAGDRSVGIVMVFFSILLGFFMMLIWPPIQTGLTAMANVIASDATNPAYVGLYGMLERLLIPTGLHHIWYAPFLTGITEPIEFTFLFIAPLLYVVHSVLTGVSFALIYALDAHIGWAGGSGLIDYVLVNVLPGTPRWWMNLVVGAGFFFVYYGIFTFAIKKWNLATPGRGGQETKLFTRKDYNEKKSGKTSIQTTALAIQEALGGRDNIIDIDACFTRLRVELKDVSQIDEDELKALGAAGVVKVKNNIQAIFGGRSDLYKNELLKLHKEMDQAN